MDRYPGAAPVTFAALLSAPVRPVPVVASLDAACYVATGDPDLPALCVAGPGAVRVPCALVVAAGVPLPRPRVGATALVGDGALVVDGRAYAVARWWRPARPDLRAVPAARLGAAARALASWSAGVEQSGWHDDPDAPRFAAAVGRLARAVDGDGAGGGGGAGDGDPTAAVAGLLGRGEGLTPLGDDVLAGALVTLRARGAAVADPLADAVRAAAPAATTAVSAALLVHAARGECVPELAGLLDAVAAGAPLDGVGGPLRRLLAVGHRSGAGLARGVAIAIGAPGRAEPGPHRRMAT